MGERKEALMRVVVLIVSGIVLGVWGMLIKIFTGINFIWTLISGKSLKDLAVLSEMWNTQSYVYLRYMTFVTNERPMPFNSLTKNFSKFKR
ncbi:MAG: DUF4389 domain-containing protein [Candidatus Pacearchaeota archaeon]|nr:DUF4389 domain-containing protein [Candidatus Pacearchaeota archaeon]